MQLAAYSVVLPVVQNLTAEIDSLFGDVSTLPELRERNSNRVCDDLCFAVSWRLFQLGFAAVDSVVQNSAMFSTGCDFRLQLLLRWPFGQSKLVAHTSPQLKARKNPARLSLAGSCVSSPAKGWRDGTYRVVFNPSTSRVVFNPVFYETSSQG